MKAVLAFGLVFVLAGVGAGAFVEPTFAPVDWWYDPNTRALCWDGRTDRPGMFYVDVDGVHETAVTNDWFYGSEGLFVAPAVAVSRGWTSIPGQDGSTAAQWGETRINPPVPHVRHPQNTDFRQEWYHIFVTKLDLPSDFTIGIQGSDGTEVRPIVGQFWISEDFGRTFQEFTPDSAPTGRPCVEAVVEGRSLKEEAIEGMRALKELALGRPDSTFVESLDRAERLVWKSLGYAHPFRPIGVDVTPAPDVLVVRKGPIRLDLVLGPSWTLRASSYDTLTLRWENGVVTTVDLPTRWPSRPLRYHDEVWVEAWQQDLAIHSRRDRMLGRPITLSVHVREASLGFTLSFDSDPVAALSFTYGVLPWWMGDAQLDPTYGHNVFLCERDATNRLVRFELHGDDDDYDRSERDQCGSGSGDKEDDDGDEDDDERGCNCAEEDREDSREAGPEFTAQCRLNPARWTDAEQATLDAECARVAGLLVRADEVLARTALEEARDTPVRDPRMQEEVERELGRSERLLSDGLEAGDRNEYVRAICHFLRSWHHAQRAKVLAQK